MQRTVSRLAAIAAILAGVLRALAALPEGSLPLDARGLQAMYLTVDILLLLGIAGVMARLGDRAGTIGVSGFALVVTGTLIIRSGERSPFGAQSYTIGAALVAIGLALLALPLFRLGANWRLASLCWLLSLAAGVASLVPGLGLANWSKSLYMTASLSFSAGTILAGVALLSTIGGRRR